MKYIRNAFKRISKVRMNIYTHECTISHILHLELAHMLRAFNIYIIIDALFFLNIYIFLNTHVYIS